MLGSTIKIAATSYMYTMRVYNVNTTSTIFTGVLLYL
jgi:hypothetical protein